MSSFCTCYAFIMSSFCTCYAFIMSSFCTCYAFIMSSFCTCYAFLMSSFCTCYAFIYPSLYYLLFPSMPLYCLYISIILLSFQPLNALVLPLYIHHFTI